MNITQALDSTTKKKRPGTPPVQFRFDMELRSKLDKLVEAHAEESGMAEDRTSVLRRLIAADYHNRCSNANRTASLSCQHPQES